MIKIDVRHKEYSGIICALIGDEDGSIILEIKEGKRYKRVKLNKYLLEIRQHMKI